MLETKRLPHILRHQTLPKSGELCRIQRLGEEIGNLMVTEGQSGSSPPKGGVVLEGQNLTALGAFASFTFTMSSRPSPRTARTARKVVHVLGELGLGLEIFFHSCPCPCPKSSSRPC